MTDTLTTQGCRPVLRLERRLRHPVDKVWRAVTEPAHLSQWYPATVTQMDLSVGGTIVFDYGEGWIARATITELDPPRVLEFNERAPEPMDRETDNLCRIELQPDGAGSLMIFTQHFSDRPAAASYATGWQGCFNALDQVLDGQTPTDERVSVDVHQSYVKAFGLDIGSVGQAAGGQTVSFERQLMRQPVPKVWTYLTGGAEPKVGSDVPETLVPSSIQPGSAIELQKDNAVAFNLQDGGTVRWDLSLGPGGARIHVTHSGINADTAPVLATWRSHIESIVERLIAIPE